MAKASRAGSSVSNSRNANWAASENSGSAWGGAWQAIAPVVRARRTCVAKERFMAPLYRSRALTPRVQWLNYPLVATV